MKRYLLVAAILTVTVLTSVAKADDFAQSLKNCSSYSESGVVETDGLKVKSHKSVLGWQGDRCVYKENINFGDVNTTVTCKFNKNQITELISVMNAYSIIQQYSDDKPDISSVSKVQNNPVIKVWNKYLQDPSTCTIEGIK